MLRIYEKTLKVLKAGSKSSTLAENGSKHTILDLCGCCRIISADELSRCYFCDQIMCLLCLVQCSDCNKPFCQNCSLALYDNKKQHVCVSCYSYQSK
ncbi:uncharacterized protein LOC131675236 [Phymastichus coffea]|uniref:uncharacterized protein LOC131675236 n=1 Tax=Phymastichus coffea TaxID=108790 RepID=UPI00273BC444|nr:uncharacterized protein LOC131675236 [Phymastichus coffea]